MFGKFGFLGGPFLFFVVSVLMIFVYSYAIFVLITYKVVYNLLILVLVLSAFIYWRVDRYRRLKNLMKHNYFFDAFLKPIIVLLCFVVGLVIFLSLFITISILV